MEQRMKMDIILLVVGITFLIYSLMSETLNIDANVFRFIVGVEFSIGMLYCILSPEDKWR